MSSIKIFQCHKSVIYGKKCFKARMKTWISHQYPSEKKSWWKLKLTTSSRRASSVLEKNPIEDIENKKLFFSSILVLHRTTHFWKWSKGGSYHYVILCSSSVYYRLRRGKEIGMARTSREWNLTSQDQRPCTLLKMLVHV